ncbi:MAG: DUF4286 family protein [Massilibacteroides sp.]|nr:DUF4286 family protein [Massilibacteroides sp.]MDD3063445.1 DUF4286 family protein [Massilibacteroides sp.]MDD4114465.1 DUF4286 family protein [Massilibacteroides sp.]MDD4660960.1 DUF4286 family protein [Massilibacteroides sp.]
MIVYNTTFHLDNGIWDEGVTFLKEVYLPRASSSGFLLNPILRRVLSSDEEEGVSYSVQFHVKNVDTLNFWLENEGCALHQELAARFGTKIAGFSTLLEEIDWKKQ